MENNIPAFAKSAFANEQGVDHPQIGMTLLDYFAIRMPEPSKEDMLFEITRDRNKNPHNEPSKPALRSEIEIACQLKYKRAVAMLEARKQYIK